MNTSILYKGGALLMAFTVFIQTVGFAVDVHYCKGEMATYSFFGKAEICEMAYIEQSNTNQKRSCCKKMTLNSERPVRQNGINKSNCCSNEMISYAPAAEFEQSVTASKHLVITDGTVMPLNFNLFISRSQSFGSILIPPPPIINQELAVLYQVFRI